MVSNHSPFTAKKIFAPYWRTIGVTAIQDLSRRPQITQYLSDLLDLTIPAFLVLIQVNVVPYLVLKKRQDMLQRIADAKKQSISDLCRDHDNMAAILANILLQTSSNVEQLVLNLLIAVSPDFSTVNSADLFMSEPQATASELLKHAGEYDEKRKPKVTLNQKISKPPLTQHTFRHEMHCNFSQTSRREGQRRAERLDSRIQWVLSLISMFLASWLSLQTRSTMIEAHSPYSKRSDA